KLIAAVSPALPEQPPSGEGGSADRTRHAKRTACRARCTRDATATACAMSGARTAPERVTVDRADSRSWLVVLSLYRDVQLEVDPAVHTRGCFPSVRSASLNAASTSGDIDFSAIGYWRRIAATSVSNACDPRARRPLGDSSSRRPGVARTTSAARTTRRASARRRSDSFNELLAEELRVRGWDRFLDLVPRHPVDAHCLTCLLDRAGCAYFTAVDARPNTPAVELPIIGDLPACVPTTLRPHQEHARLEEAMTPHVEPEHGPAEHRRLIELRAHHVLDHVWESDVAQTFSNGADKPGVLDAVTPFDRVQVVPLHVVLTRRRGVDHVEIALEKSREATVEGLERVALVKLERIVRLRREIDTDNIEARAVVAHRRAARAAEQVEQSRPRVYVGRARHHAVASWGASSSGHHSSGTPSPWSSATRSMRPRLRRSASDGLPNPPRARVFHLRVSRFAERSSAARSARVRSSVSIASRKIAMSSSRIVIVHLVWRGGPSGCVGSGRRA